MLKQSSVAVLILAYLMVCLVLEVTVFGNRIMTFLEHMLFIGFTGYAVILLVKTVLLGEN